MSTTNGLFTGAGACTGGGGGGGKCCCTPATCANSSNGFIVEIVFRISSNFLGDLKRCPIGRMPQFVAFWRIGHGS